MWSPIRSRPVIITSEKQIRMSAEHESNLFSRVMITYRIELHSVLLQIYCKNYNFRKISKAVVFVFALHVKIKYSPCCFAHSFSVVGCFIEQGVCFSSVKIIV